jgi:hypothetical protein
MPGLKKGIRVELLAFVRPRLLLRKRLSAATWVSPGLMKRDVSPFSYMGSPFLSFSLFPFSIATTKYLKGVNEAANANSGVICFILSLSVVK